MSNYLFLYGTLQPDHAPAEIIRASKKLRRVCEGSVRGTLYDLGDYPGAVLDNSAGGSIYGTVFELPNDEDLLTALDQYEDFHPENVQGSLFVRTLHPVMLASGEFLQCWMYVYNRDPVGARRIPSGRYSRI